MDRRAALLSLAHLARALPAPRSLKATSVGFAGVTLRWTAPKGPALPARYLVLRDGKRLAQTKRLSYTDHTVKAGRTYRYTVQAVDAHHHAGAASSAVKVVVPARPVAPAGPGAAVPITPGGSASPDTSIAPVADGGTDPGPDPGPPAGGGTVPTPPAPMTTAMVDRLFWRAGFGPSDVHRQAWTGKPAADLVDWMLDTAPTLAATSTPPLTLGNQPIDPLASDDELVMEWLDRMQRADNPFPERLAFFWHRHWAVSRDSGVPAEWLVTYRNRMRGFADLAGNPTLSFRSVALDMTTKDGAMSYFLNGASNQKGSPNENYAREFMELFCLGPSGPDGAPNYTQNDVQELARAFTGWRLDQDPSHPTYGAVSFGGNAFFDAGSKTIFGQTTAFTAAQAVDAVLAHPSHAQFLIRKLWAEFIVNPIPQATLDALVALYTAGGALTLRPVLRAILTDPLVFASIDEPNMVKPPIVYTVGVLRQLNVPMKAYWIPEAMTDMQQRPYHPPNVAGWEGGLAWLNSNTVQARFDLLVRAQYLKYKGGAASSYPAGGPPADVPGETPQQAFDRAYGSATSPWLAPATRTALMAYASAAPVATAAQRRQRFYSLQALMLGGPDGQVM